MSWESAVTTNKSESYRCIVMERETDRVHGVSYGNAVKFYQEAVEGSKKMQGVNSIWAVTWSNLGHSYRHLE